MMNRSTIGVGFGLGLSVGMAFGGPPSIGPSPEELEAEGIDLIGASIQTRGFLSPVGLPFGKVLLIPDSTNDVVSMFDPHDGTYLGDLINGAGTFSTPIHAVQGPDGNIYVSDQVNDSVYVYDTTGAFLSVYADASDGLNNVRGIDFRGANLFVTSGDDYVAEFAGPHNRLADYINDGTDPFDVTFLADGSCVVTETNGVPDGIRLYDPSGTFVAKINSGDFPEQVSLDSLGPGDLLAAYFTADKCDDFDVNGVLSQSTPSANSLRGATRLGNGNLLLTNTSLGVVEVTPGTGAIVNTRATGTGWRFIQEIELSNWSDLGHALPGAAGAPVLVGDGHLASGAQITISLSNAPVNQAATLIVGVQNVSAPLFGGILVPSPNFLIPIPVGALGSVTFATVLPNNVIPNIPVFLQYWITDPTAPQGYSASNAITATTE